MWMLCSYSWSSRKPDLQAKLASKSFFDSSIILLKFQYTNEAANMPSTRNSIELLTNSMEKLSKLMIRLSGTNLFMKKMEMEDTGFVPVGLDMGHLAKDYDDDTSKSTTIMTQCGYFWLFFSLQSKAKRTMLKVVRKKRKCRREAS